MTLSPRDRVRLEVGDTNTADALFSDEEIDAYLADNPGNILAVASALCEVLATRYAVKADTTIGSLSFKWSNVSEAFAKRAQALLAQSTSGAPWAGGTSQSDKDARAADSDRVQGRFSRGQFANPGAVGEPPVPS